MTDEYYSGSGHPITVDPTGKSDKKSDYDELLHGFAVVMCPKKGCKNMEVFVKDYEQHLLDYHDMEIDPVQDRLMKSSAMVKESIRKSKYVWAPFPDEIPQTVYDMHMEAMIREENGQI